MHNVFYINVDPVIFHLGPVSIGWYGLMVALAVVFLVAWLYRNNNREHVLSNDSLITAALIGIVSGLIFTKLLHVIDLWDYYIQHPGDIFSGNGLTIWGAVLGATLGIWAYSRITKQFSFARFGDMIAPGTMVAQAIGRVGCTLNGCCYGIESDSACAIVYNNPHSNAPLGIPVLPTQVFEIAFDLCVFVVLMLLRGKLKPSGALFTVYFFLYGLWRFCIEFIRDGTPFLLGMHQAQLIGLILMLITLPIIIIKVRWKN